MTIINASQLRSLARDHFQGQLARLEYLKQRRELIDAIVAGDIAIERETRIREPRPAAAETDPAAPTADRRHRRIRWYQVLAGLVVVVLIAWALIPGAPPPPPAALTVVATPQRQISAARSLVESFVAGADWSELSIARFQDAWRALPANERHAAVDSAWWRRLNNAIHQERRTQKALAEIDQTGASQAAMRRLAALQAFLRSSAGQAPAAESQPVPAAAQSNAPVPPTPNAQPASAADDVAPPAPVAGLSGSAWLRAQAPGNFSLQLFALNHLNRVERLIAAYPDLELKVIATHQTAPRYRVLYGSFASEAAARGAYAALPSAVRREQPVPMVKGIAELRGASPSNAVTPTGDWLARQDRGRVALQIFVSNTRENVTRLIAEFPALGLQVHEASTGRYRYRVLLGSFASDAAARAAADKLPPNLLKEAGKPVLKTIAELQDEG